MEEWITPSRTDPEGWSEQVAKTKLRIWICTLIHLGFVSFGLWMIYASIQKFRDNPDLNTPTLSLFAVLNAGGPILFFGVGFPAMYLYAMHRLLSMRNEQGKIAA